MKYLTEEMLNKVLEYVINYQLENGVAPSYREIGEACHIPSKSSVTLILNRLYDSGELENYVCDSRRYISVPNNLSVSKNKVANVVGNVACGSPILAVENIESTVALPNDIFGTYDKYILKAKGDSMINKGIKDGDLLVVQKTNYADPGQIIIARVNNDEVTAKILARDNKSGNLYLKPASDVKNEDGSPKYTNIYPEGDWEICGIVKFVIHEIG